ncbi:universal stress protein [Iamia majanohamensis]|uniref:Universal stress protein n=1 Tax=Iamia majanohamensis TaxID=467976 RepID=A0AAF0BU61_9ACTN|nr:universal stress protein [Iamia majanohamensis]WCO65723.1 universal stress protein [Iamia majanohamensis]
MKVIIATDGSDPAVEAAHEAVGLLRPDAEVIVVAVVADREDPMETAGGIEGPVLTEEQADEDAERALARGEQAVRRTVAATPAPARAEVLPSHERTEEALAELVAREGADLLVIGSAQPGWLQRLLGSSTVDRIVHHAPCPVLVVPHTDDG